MSPIEKPCQPQGRTYAASMGLIHRPLFSLLAMMAGLLFILHPLAAEETVDDRYRIMGYSHVNRRQFENYLLQKNPRLRRKYVRKIVRLYDEECRMEDVRPAVAFAQMCHETGFLEFWGRVLWRQNNFCGYGVVDSSSRGASFRTMREGVRVHVQHLKAYGSKEPLRNPNLDVRRRFIDKRFLGADTTVFDLSGTWAANENYGRIIARLVDELCAR